MLYNFRIDDLIPLLAIGAISIIAIYHSFLYFFSRLTLVGSYTLYLWFALLYLILAITTVPEKTFKIPSVYYLISSGAFWISLLCYLNFLLVVLEIPKAEETKIYKIIKRTYLATPFYFLLRFPYFFFPTKYVEIVKAIGLLMDCCFFATFGYLAYLLITTKKSGIKNYVVIGNILIVSFNFFTSFTYYTQGYLFGLSHVSFIALGYFSDVIFFSLAVGLHMSQNIKEKYIALNEVNKKEMALQIEKQKATDILLTQDLIIEKERAKAVIEQRTIIGRKLHDDLSGSLVALRYFIEDKLKKANSKKEIEDLEEIDEEIKSIYKDTRDYSHLLSGNELEPTSNYYNIDQYLETMQLRLEKLSLFRLKTFYHKEEIENKLTPKISEQIYFLIKESLSNIIKHAEATEVFIRILFEQNQCIIEIKDNGKGFKNNHAYNGQGIKNQKLRLKQINGQLNISSSNKGTLVKAIVPVNA